MAGSVLASPGDGGARPAGAPGAGPGREEVPLGPEVADVVVIGAGFAGASAAWHLCRAGAGRVLVLEREALPGLHASGRNAALADLLGAEPEHAPLLREGLRFLASPPEGFSAVPLLRVSGSLRLGSRRDLRRLRRAAAAAGDGGGAPLEEIPVDEAARRVPLLAGAGSEAALWSPAAGVVDIHALLRGFLDGVESRGGRVACGAGVVGVRGQGRRRFVVETSSGRIAAGAVVDAAGAWAAEVARLAGASPLALASFRRHLFQSAPLAGVDPRGPFVWEETAGFYFRPEAGGLLLSPCDRTPHPPVPPLEDPRARESLAEKLVRTLPRLSGVRVARGWACLRTFVPDGRFVVGEDPALEGFFWAAGLGGSGVVAGPALGRLAAQAVLRALTPGGASEALSPARFARGSPE